MNTNKTIIVTGANSGLGLWTTKYLLDLDYTVIMACRDIEKTKEAIAAFPEFDQKKNYHIYKLDLADFDSIRNFVATLSDVNSIYGLVCNAGITYEGPFRYTKNGIEQTFGTNHVGHFLLTNLLLETYHIEKIAIVTSALHDPANKSPFAKAAFKSIDQLAHPTVNKDIPLSKQTESFYATSKLCNILFAHELELRLKKKNIQQKTYINTFNPGFMPSTNFGRSGKRLEKISRILMGFFFKILGFVDVPEKSAKKLVGLIDEVTNTGNYYDRGKPIKSSVESYDAEKAIQLWEGSEQLVGQKFL